MPPEDFVRLSHSGREVGVAPARGGVLTYFRERAASGVIDWLRPSDDASDDHGAAPERSACFPLVPFSNRVALGQFDWDGAAVRLPANGGEHAIHGFGWRAVWTVSEQTEDRVRIVNHHPASAWPWSYEAWQDIRLDAEGLAIEIGLRNTGADVMPAGLGLHPYFPRDEPVSLRAQVDAHYPCGPDMLPLARDPAHPAVAALRDGDGLPIGLDGVFDGWSGAASLVWRDCLLTITAEPALARMVLYTPDTDFFCLEPVSHLSNALNLPAERQAAAGLRRLAPGEALHASVRFTPGPIPPPSF